MPLIKAPTFLLFSAPWVITVFSYKEDNSHGYVSKYSPYYECVVLILTSYKRDGLRCYLFICKGGEELLKFVSTVSLGQSNYLVDFSSHYLPAKRHKPQNGNLVVQKKIAVC